MVSVASIHSCGMTFALQHNCLDILSTWLALDRPLPPLWRHFRRNQKNLIPNCLSYAIFRIRIHRKHGRNGLSHAISGVSTRTRLTGLHFALHFSWKAGCDEPTGWSNSSGVSGNARPAADCYTGVTPVGPRRALLSARHRRAYRDSVPAVDAGRHRCQNGRLTLQRCVVKRRHELAGISRHTAGCPAPQTPSRCAGAFRSPLCSG